jgi:hypothetical protein
MSANFYNFFLRWQEQTVLIRTTGKKSHRFDQILIPIWQYDKIQIDRVYIALKKGYFTQSMYYTYYFFALLFSVLCLNSSVPPMAMENPRHKKGENFIQINS